MIVLKFYSEKSESVSQSLSHVQLFVSPLTVAHQALLSMELSRQEYWSGLPFPPPGDLCAPGIEPGSPALQVDSSLSEPPGKPPCSLGTCQTVQWEEGEQRGESWSPRGRLERNRASRQEPTQTRQCGQSATSVRIWAEEQLYSGWA